MAETTPDTEERYTLDLPRLIEAVANGEAPADELTVRILGAFHPALRDTDPDKLAEACRMIMLAASARGQTVEEALVGLSREQA